jgi:hypothetical protein
LNPEPRLTSLRDRTPPCAPRRSDTHGSENPGLKMTAHSIPSPTSYPNKRARPSSPDKDSPTSLSAGGAASPTTGGDVPADAGSSLASNKVGQSSNFRNVSACNRCRLRKNRCDQKLPSCASCDKAGVACVGYDPITKREIPRRFGTSCVVWTIKMDPDRVLATCTTSKHESSSSRPCSGHTASPFRHQRTSNIAPGVVPRRDR